MDVHVPLSVTKSLRFSGADIITAQEDGTSAIDDAALLDRATALRRVLETKDQDFLQIGTR
jgi:predicted nuclease of predicted toxin-antitoxin system